jgi:hypothetical protein
MRTTTVGAWKVGLTATYGEYNCGNKTTGRLALVVTDGKSNINQGSQKVATELEDPKIRDEVIGNFLKDIDDRSTHIPLNSGCKFFPGDHGVYPPGILMYADAVRMDKSYKWYNNWKALIEVFETEPKFKVVILKSPILPNRYYGPSKPSRVWTIVLPTISKHVCFDKKHVTAEMKDNLTGLVGYAAESKLLKAELSSLGIAV